MLKLNHVLAVFIFGVLAQGCMSSATEDSDKVVSERIHQSYSVDYDEEKDLTSASASFRFGSVFGTTLRLVGKSAVFNSVVPLRETRMLGTSYTGEKPGAHLDHRFEYTDDKGKLFINRIAITKIGIAGNAPTSLVRTSAFSVTWEGAPLGKHEWVTVFLRSQTGDKSALGSVSQVGATGVSIPARDLADLPPGNYTLQLEREKRESTQSSGETGGSMFSSYYTRKRAITVQ